MLKIKDSDYSYYVYEHLFPNGKRYIGITTNPKRRWSNGLGYNHNIYMKRAIMKYGWNNIKHNILFENKSKKEAERLECELICLYKSNTREWGYNIANGGNSIGKHSDISKQKMRNYALNRPKIHNEKISKSKIGKKLNLSEEQRLSLSNRFKGNKYGCGHQTFLNKHHTEESKSKISLALKNKPSWNKGKKRTLEHTITNVKSHQKPIIQLDKNMNILKEFPSIKIAMEITHINNICKCCRNIQKSAGGYIWRYKIQSGLVEKVEGK